MAISLGGLGFNPDRLAHAHIGPAATALYTAPGSGTARSSVSGIAICNPSASDLKIRLGLIPQGGTSDGSHFLFGGQTVKANTSLFLDTTVILRPGDKLEAYSDALPPPATFNAVSATTGGTLAATTYYYKITALNAGGQTVGSNEIQATTTTATSTVALTWDQSLTATSYKIYRSSSAGTETLLTTIGSGSTVAFTDTGALTPDGSTTVPTAGTANGCIFTIAGAELPA